MLLKVWRQSLHSANIEYVKWDMNRQLSDLGSMDLPADRQEVVPQICVGGIRTAGETACGISSSALRIVQWWAGFDPGMLYYSPQMQIARMIRMPLNG